MDFVRKEGYMAVELIQVCYDLGNIDTEDREIKALLEAGGELKVTKLTLITWNEKREVEGKGMKIQIIPLWEWLLHPKN